jgi:hypothetical protein
MRLMTGSGAAALCMALSMGFQSSAATPDVSPTQDLAVQPGVMANFIAVGLVDPQGRVPAINAVPGAGVQNLAVALPTSVLQHGTSYEYVLSSQNVTFKGTCIDSYTLSRGKVILDHKVIRTYACAPGNEWEWAAVGKAIPNSPGPATLTGTVTYGKLSVTTVTKVLIK